MPGRLHKALPTQPGTGGAHDARALHAARRAGAFCRRRAERPVSVGARIAAALAAHAFGQAVTVASQLVLTPLYFRLWGAATYGEWLILASVPAYLAMADLGIGSAAGNEMTMRAAAGDRTGAQRTLLGALWVAGGAAALALALGLMAAACAYHWQMPHTPNVAPVHAALILVGLALTVALGFVGGLASAGFRCCERNALGIMAANSARLAEALTVAALLLARQPPVVICLGMVGVKVAAVAVQWLVLWRVCPWLFVPRLRADRAIVQRLIKPALGFLAFPLGNALALQGPILIVGAVFGGPAVAMFSALRTLARVPMQLTTMLNSSVWPEMSRAQGSGNLNLLQRLHRTSWGMTALLVLGMAIALELLGRPIALLWLGDSAPFEPLVFSLLLLLTVVSALWNSSAVVLTATNSHLALAGIYVAVTASSLALGTALAPAFGWLALLGCLAAAEAAMLAWVLPQVLKLTSDRLPDFAKSALYGGLRRLTSRWSSSGRAS